MLHVTATFGADHDAFRHHRAVIIFHVLAAHHLLGREITDHRRSAVFHDPGFVVDREDPGLPGLGVDGEGFRRLIDRGDFSPIGNAAVRLRFGRRGGSGGFGRRRAVLSGCARSQAESEGADAQSSNEYAF